MRKIRILLSAIFFFTLGVLSANFLPRFISPYINAQSASDPIEEQGITRTPSPITSYTWQELPTVTPSRDAGEENYSYTPAYSSRKFIIEESRHISPNKAEVQTGEEVRLTAGLKNIGTERKFLTHICFNHSGGVTFGCIMNMNLEPGQEFAFDNGMMFDSPGTYRVWLTWSQDKKNFYRPLNAGTATVKVY